MRLPILIGVLLMTSTLNAQPFDHQHLMWFQPADGTFNRLQSREDWEKRRAAILTSMQQVMGDLPARDALPALDVKATQTIAGTNYHRQTISLANLYNERVTAYLYLPDNLNPNEKRPAALALQPTGMEGKDISDRTYARELAQRGFVVIAPDYPSFGEQKDYDFYQSHYASGSMKAISDNMRCIDLLQSLSQVDKDKIACIGHSLGGHNTLFTAAFDPRIKVAITSCGWTPFHFYYGGKKLQNWAQLRYMPRITSVYQNNPDQMPFDFQEVIAAIAPRAVFSNSPTGDENFDVAGVKKAEPEIRKVFQLLGVDKNLVVRYPDCAHDFPENIRKEAYEFISMQFGR